MFGLLADQGVGSIPWSPLAKGRLARPWGEQTHRSENDPMGSGPSTTATRAIVDAVQQVAEARGVPMAQVALAWVLNNPVVSRTDRRRDQGAPPRRRGRGARPRPHRRRGRRPRGGVHGAAALRLQLISPTDEKGRARWSATTRLNKRRARGAL